MIVVDDTEDLSSLIGDIYGASLDPTLWCDVHASKSATFTAACWPES
jgi:hypothetical protein